MEITNLNPAGENISDCSTRSIVYCLGTDYEKTREIQDKIALLLTELHGVKTYWNEYPVLEAIMVSRGWVKIMFRQKVLRYRLAQMLKSRIRIFTESSGHVAPIYDGKIVDTWDCSKGRVFSIIVPRRNLNSIASRLEENSVDFVVC